MTASARLQRECYTRTTYYKQFEKRAMLHCKKSNYVPCWARLKRGIDHFGAAAAMENEE